MRWNGGQLSISSLTMLNSTSPYPWVMESGIILWKEGYRSQLVVRYHPTDDLIITVLSIRSWTPSGHHWCLQWSLWCYNFTPLLWKQRNEWGRGASIQFLNVFPLCHPPAAIFSKVARVKLEGVLGKALLWRCHKILPDIPNSLSFWSLFFFHAFLKEFFA